MFAMELDSIVAEIADFFEFNNMDFDYDKGIYTAKGLLFAFDVSLSYWLNEEEFSRRRKIYVVLSGHKLWCSDYNSLNWVNVSNHDSCWKTELHYWITAVYFNMAHAIADDIEHSHTLEHGVTPAVTPKPKRIAPIDCHMFVHRPLCEKMFRTIAVKFTKENEQRRRTLLNIEFADLQTVQGNS